MFASPSNSRSAPSSASASATDSSIAVFGATGLQGGSVITHLLLSTTDNQRSYNIRAITRNVTQAKARTLEDQGKGRVQLVQADLDDEEEVKKAVEGQDYVFVRWLVGRRMERKPRAADHAFPDLD